MNNNPSENINRNPFKFLDSYTKQDNDIFFGRKTELEEVYRKFYKSKILLVYGKSGTGKSSIINCGLVSKIPSEDVLIIPVRCGKDPAANLKNDLLKFVDGGNRENVQNNSILEILDEIYLENFKPITILFDQFEEIFILSTAAERKKLVGELLKITKSKIRANLVIIFREEYFASFSEFETDIPNLFENRVRIEKLNKMQVKELIEKPCKICNVGIEPGLSEKIAGLLSQETGVIELTYFQILMDKLYKMATERSADQPVLKIEDLTEIGDIGNILGDFLNNQLLEMENASEVEAVLKAMISEDGTKKRVTPVDIVDSLKKSETDIPDRQVKNILQDLINKRIVSEKDEQGFYEIKHDSLAQRIYDRLTADERKLKEIQLLLKNTYKQHKQVGTLINERTLRYVEPYEEKLVLTSEITDYINKSKQTIYKQKRRKRNIGVVSGSLIVILAVLFGIFSYRAKEEAKLQERISKSKELANKALLYVENDPTKAYLLGEKAYNTYPTFESEKAILNAYKNGPFYNKIEGNHFIISKSKKHIIATSSLNNNIRIYDFLGNLISICEGHNGPIQSKSLKLSDNEKYILSESVIDSTIRIWDIKGKELFKINKGGYKFFGVLPNDNIYVLSKNDYQLYNIQGEKLSSIEFDKSILKINIDTIYAAVLTSDSIVEIHKLSNFETIAQSNNFTHFDLKSSDLISKDEKKIVIVKTNSSNYYLWNWGENIIYPLDYEKDYRSRHFDIRKDYIIENSKWGFNQLIIRNTNNGKIILDFPTKKYKFQILRK